MAGAPFALGSMYAAVPAALCVGLAVLRTELEGYAAFAGRVRRRLVPGVW
jgi:hypothetical protein